MACTANVLPVAQRPLGAPVSASRKSGACSLKATAVRRLASSFGKRLLAQPALTQRASRRPASRVAKAQEVSTSVPPTVSAMTSTEVPAPADMDWKALHGYGEDGSATSWKGLLPEESNGGVLNEALRSELLKYGEMAQATYDNYYKGLNDPKFGEPRYEEAELLEKSLPANSLAKDYQIVDYIYATSGAYNLSKYSNLPSIVEWANKFLHNVHAPNVADISRVLGYAVKSNWIGYIAISPDKGEGVDVVIAWRGTIMKTEWASNVFQKELVPWDPEQPEGPMVHSGFVNIYRNSHGLPDLKPQEDQIPLEEDHKPQEDQNPLEKGQKTRKDQSPQEVVHNQLQSLLKGHKIRSVTTTGHSLGGALAIISAADVAQYLRSVDLKGSSPIVTAFPFAPPQPGDKKFKDLMTSDLKVQVLATVNIHDLVPYVPNLFSRGDGESADSAKAGGFVDDTKVIVKNMFAEFRKHHAPARDHGEYVAVGEHLFLDSAKSAVLKHGLTDGGAEDKKKDFVGQFGARHNLEQYLWLTATQYVDKQKNPKPEPEGPTDEVAVRDWALVNKGDDELLSKFCFPGSWWPVPQKTETGVWRLP